MHLPPSLGRWVTRLIFATCVVAGNASPLRDSSRTDNEESSEQEACLTQLTAYYEGVDGLFAGEETSLYPVVVTEPHDQGHIQAMTAIAMGGSREGRRADLGFYHTPYARQIANILKQLTEEGSFPAARVFSNSTSITVQNWQPFAHPYTSEWEAYETQLGQDRLFLNAAGNRQPKREVNNAQIGSVTRIFSGSVVIGAVGDGEHETPAEDTYMAGFTISGDGAVDINEDGVAVPYLATYQDAPPKCMESYGTSPATALAAYKIDRLMERYHPAIPARVILQAVLATAELYPIPYESFITNGAGLEFSPLMGFGRINVVKAQEVLDAWQAYYEGHGLAFPQETRVTSSIPAPVTIAGGGGETTFSLPPPRAEDGADAPVLDARFVVFRYRLANVDQEQYVQISLISPSGTEIMLKREDVGKRIRRAGRDRLEVGILRTSAFLGEQSFIEGGEGWRARIRETGGRAGDMTLELFDLFITGPEAARDPLTLLPPSVALARQTAAASRRR